MTGEMGVEWLGSLASDKRAINWSTESDENDYPRQMKWTRISPPPPADLSWVADGPRGNWGTAPRFAQFAPSWFQTHPTITWKILLHSSKMAAEMSDNVVLWGGRAARSGDEVCAGTIMRIGSSVVFKSLFDGPHDPHIDTQSYHI